MDIARLRASWEHFGADDPLWAILTDPSKRGGKWDPVQFFETGEREIASVLARAGALPASRRNALDFGCGVGRLTQALATRFERVIGVDISAAMLEGARRFNVAGDRCTYIQNDRPDLAVLGDERFDFIYSNIVLQHMEPDLALRYVREFVRLLADGGLLVFQAPSRKRLRPIARLESIVWRWRVGRAASAEAERPRGPVMEMHAIPRSSIVAALAGTEIVRMERDRSSGDEWIAWKYWVTRALRPAP